MNIFLTSLSLIMIGIAMVHPVFFIPIDKQIQKGNFNRSFLQKNFLIHLIAGLISILLYWIYSINYPLQLSGVVYLVVIIVVILFYWNTKLTKWNLFTASILFGFIVFYRSINEIVEITPLWPGVLTGLLGSSALSILIILMVATIKKPEVDNTDNTLIDILLKTMFLIIGIRIAWNIVILFNLSVETQYGDVISAFKFFWQADSIKLSLTIISGILIPILYLIVFRKTMNDFNNRSTLLLVLFQFASVLTAEFLYKYFLLQYGIVL